MKQVSLEYEKLHLQKTNIMFVPYHNLTIGMLMSWESIYIFTPEDID